MSKENGKIKYFAYLRKSSEDKERQALSIPAQKDKLIEMFADCDIEFIEEERSAFIPHNRPKFLDVLARIRNGERQGLIAWHPDRLSRNEVDASSLTYMLRTGEIKSLKIATYHFENTPEGIWMLQMALSQSQYESAKKGRDVKRGLEKKAKMGNYPAPAPIGYINDKFTERGNKKILTDEERHPLLRKMVDLMLTGNYTAPEILDIANDEWRFRTLKGKKMSRSTIYNVFTRPFYYGEYEYPVGSGAWHKGTHKPLMTRDEFDRIQFLLGRSGKPRPKSKHDIAYRGPIHCAECGALITGEDKYKKLAKGGTNHYVYYHCTKRKNPNCSQKAVEEKTLEEQIIGVVTKFEIPDDFKKWALSRLKEMNHKEIDDREKIYGKQLKDYDACVRKIDKLIDMRADEELDEQEFKAKKITLLTEKNQLEALLKDTAQRVENWLEIADRGFNFAERAYERLREAIETKNPELKKQIFTGIGSNYTLNAGKLSISLDDLLLPLESVAAETWVIKEMLELQKKQGVTTDSGEIYSENPRMLPGLDSNQDTRLQRAMSYH